MFIINYQLTVTLLHCSIIFVYVEIIIIVIVVIVIIVIIVVVVIVVANNIDNCLHRNEDERDKPKC